MKGMIREPIKDKRFRCLKERSFIQRLCTKKAPQMRCFFYVLHYQVHEMSIAYFAAAYLFATSFQLITLKNALM